MLLKRSSCIFLPASFIPAFSFMRLFSCILIVTASFITASVFIASVCILYIYVCNTWNHLSEVSFRWDPKHFTKEHILLCICPYGWDVLPHLSHRHDMTSTNHHLFVSLQRHLFRKQFQIDDAVIAEEARYQVL